MSDVRDSVLGPIARSLPDPSAKDPADEIIAVDFGNLVRKLVLFDHVWIESLSVGELPQLIRKFGPDATAALLSSGRIRLLCHEVLATQVGQTVGVAWLPGVLPLGSYSFATARIDRKPQIDKHMSEINDLPGLPARQSKRLRKLIGERIVEPRASAGTAALDQLKLDCEVGNPVLNLAIASAAQRELQLSIKPGEFGLRIEQINEHEWRSETTLQNQFGLSDEQVHELVQRGLLGVGELNLRLERMETYSTLSGFQQNETPLMDAKLGFLARQLDPETQEKRFERVVDLVGLPDVDPNPEVHDVDLGRLIEITADPEVVAFRSWVHTIDHLDDDEVAAQIHRIRDMLGEAVRTKAGKAVRFGVTTGVGVVVPPAGIVLGALDTFATEKLLPEPGPIAFLSRLYPSVFNAVPPNVG